MPSGALASNPVVVDRDEFSTTTQLADGKLKTSLSSEPVNVERDGSWSAVDTTLVEGSGEVLRPESVDGDIRIPSTLGLPVELEHDDREVSFRLLGASGSVDASGSAAQFSDALSGVDARYEARPRGVKETLVLSSASATRVFRYDVRATSAWSAEAAGGDIVLKDGGGTERYRVSAPLAWDSAADPSFSNALALSVEKISDGRWTVTLRPDTGWLDDPARQYPVSIDPDFTWTSGTTHFHGATDCYMAGGSQAAHNFCASSYLQTGNYLRPYRSLFKFDIAAAIPSNATVSAATFKAYSPPATPHALGNHRLHTVTSDWDSTATWNNRKVASGGNTAWTSGGGDISTNPAYTSSAAVPVNGHTAWYTFPAPTATVQDWVNGTLPNHGFLVKTDSGAPNTQAYAWASTEASTSSSFPATSNEWPTLDVTWSAPSGGDTSPPSPPTEFALDPTDPEYRYAWLRYTPGTDQGPDASGYETTELRFKRGLLPFTDWMDTNTETAWMILNIQAGDTVIVEGRTRDGADNLSTVATQTFVVESATPSAAFDEMASDYLIREHGMTAAQADTWLTIQSYATVLGEFLEDPNYATEAEHYGGMWFNNATQKVHLNITAASGATELAGLVQDFSMTNAVVYDPVNWTETEIGDRSSDIQDDLEADIAIGAVEVSYTLAPPSVMIEVAADASSAVQARAAAKATSTGLPVTVSTAAWDQGPTGEQSCDERVVPIPVLGGTSARSVCDMPLRGGVFLANTYLASCTAGYPAKNEDNEFFMLTAGHCTRKDPRSADASTYTRATDGSSWALGKEEDAVYNGQFGKNGDVSLIKIDQPTKLRPLAMIWLQKYRGNAALRPKPDEERESFRIGATGIAREHQTLCFSGAVSGGHCGEVPKGGARFKDRNKKATKVRLCGTQYDKTSHPNQTVGGDSGGPWYGKTTEDLGTAHGTHIGVFRTDTRCLSIFHDVREAEKKFDVQILATARASREGYGGAIIDCGGFSCHPD